MPFVVTEELGRELVKRGVVDADCRVLAIEFVVGEVCVIRYERYLNRDDLQRISEALTVVFGETRTP
jgi:hypothetical protein